MYNLFGFAHEGADVEPFLRRRAAQGFNLLRVRVPVSPFHPPDGYNVWQTRRTWAWGGSEQAPRFDRFNLDWFATVDRVVQLAEEIGIGLEIIMEGWGFEFPFNHRAWFTAEWEALWMRYLIARYDAYTSTLVWTPLNEYEYYPNGDWNYKVADQWALRVARYNQGRRRATGIRSSCTTAPACPPSRSGSPPTRDAVDAILVSGVGNAGRTRRLARRRDRGEDRAPPSRGGAVLRSSRSGATSANPRTTCSCPHTSSATPTTPGAGRGAARCAASASSTASSIHGGRGWIWTPTSRGWNTCLHLRRFFTEVSPFEDLKPAPQILIAPEAPVPRLRSRPVGPQERQRLVARRLSCRWAGRCRSPCPPPRQPAAQWFDPRTGELHAAKPDTDNPTRYVAPPSDNRRTPRRLRPRLRRRRRVGDESGPRRYGDTEESKGDETVSHKEHEGTQRRRQFWGFLCVLRVLCALCGDSSAFCFPPCLRVSVACFRIWIQQEGAMHVLMIGGTGLISAAMVPELLARGERVTLYNRGQTAPSVETPPEAAK